MSLFPGLPDNESLPGPYSPAGQGWESEPESLTRVLHPKISEVWSAFFQQLPNFTKRYRFYRQVPIFPDEFSDIFLSSYL